MTLEIFGYAGCTTVKKARDWAEAEEIDVSYTHFAKVPDLEDRLTDWIAKAGLEAVLNSKSQGFKKLESAEQARLQDDETAAITTMLADPRFIKRPVGTDGASVLTGFKQDDWVEAFKG